MDTLWQTATFGGGCFWCIEAIFAMVQGVVDVRPGYADGHQENPSYEQVTSGNTGHAEVVQVKYRSSEVDYKTLVQLFFHIHNPTTLNRQGHDVGTQYRSIILTQGKEQEQIAKSVLQEVQKSNLWGNDPIVTEIKALQVFWQAEAYHWNYFERNPNQGYCQLVIAPKVAKFKKQYPQLLKSK